MCGRSRNHAELPGNLIASPRRCSTWGDVLVIIDETVVSAQGKDADDRDKHDLRLLKELLVIVLVIIVGALGIAWCHEGHLRQLVPVASSSRPR